MLFCSTLDMPFHVKFIFADEFQGPKKKPRILPGEDIDENSMKVSTIINAFI